MSASSGNVGVAKLAEGSVAPAECFLASRQGGCLAALFVSERPISPALEVLAVAVKPLYVFASAVDATNAF